MKKIKQAGVGRSDECIARDVASYTPSEWLIGSSAWNAAPEPGTMVVVKDYWCWQSLGEVLVHAKRNR